MPKRISADSRRSGAVLSQTPVRVAIVTLDSHMASAVDRARVILKKELPGLTLSLHAVAEWGTDASAPTASAGCPAVRGGAGSSGKRAGKGDLSCCECRSLAVKCQR